MHSMTNFVDATTVNAWAVAIDRHMSPNHLYVVDGLNNRVLGYNDASTFANAQAADLVLGQPDFFSNLPNGGLSSGTNANVLSLNSFAREGIGVDSGSNVWLSDPGNRRVVGYPAPFSSGKTQNEAATTTATPTPVPGKLKVSPKALNFGTVEVGASKIKSVKITNAGKVVKKKKITITPPPILIEMESGVASPFSLTQECNDENLGPKSKGVPPGTCEVSVTFKPGAAGKYAGTMKIVDNLEPSFAQDVKLEGTGKAPKK